MGKTQAGDGGKENGKVGPGGLESFRGNQCLQLLVLLLLLLLPSGNAVHPEPEVAVSKRLRFRQPVLCNLVVN